MEDELENALIDEVLAEDFLECDSYASDEYDRWRDDQCDNLFDDLKELADRHIYPKKHGYFKENAPKFLEDAVYMLQEICKCNLTVNNDRVLAVKREPVKVEFVEEFLEDKHEEVPITTKP
jgi:hypothetical protein